MLSSDLYSEIRPEFLRLLGSPAARVYIDTADAIEREAALRPGPMPRDEGLAIIERVVERHAEVEIEEASGQPARERARIVLERLCTAEWLRTEERADYSRFLFVEPGAVCLLEALRKIARPGAAVFSDSLIGACTALRNSDALRGEPWPIIQNCLEQVHRGEQEIRAVAKSIQRHTRRQLSAQSLRENLEVVFDRYAADIGHGAYAELVRSRLPTRLPEARDAVGALQNDADLLHKMADEVVRRSGCDYATAMARVRNGLHDLAQALDRIIPSADEVDRRTAEFTRKSLARFRYLQEVTGEQRSAVQAFFEKLNAHFAGRRVVDAEAEISELPLLRLAEIKIPAGLESLYAPRLRRDLNEIEALDEEVGDEVLDRTQRQLAATLRDSLTVARANRFAAEAFTRHGVRVRSSDLLHTDDDLADLIACLLHASAREAKFCVEVARDLDEPAGDLREEDLVLAGTRRLERFTLAKKVSDEPAQTLLRLEASDRARLGETLRALLDHGSILGAEGPQSDLYHWAYANRPWIEEMAALFDLQLFWENESRLVQAVPRSAAFLLRLRLDATLVLLTLWYEFDSAVRDRGETPPIVFTAEQLNDSLRTKFEPLRRAMPAQTRLLEILRLAQRKNLLRFIAGPEPARTRIEVLPTIKRIIPFQDIADWTRHAERFLKTDSAAEIPDEDAED